MIEFLRSGMKFECPFCQEKSIGLWTKIRVFGVKRECKCSNCGVVLRYSALIYGMKIIVVILALIIGLYFIYTYPIRSAVISSNIPLAIIAVFEIAFVRFAKLRYRPDGKHPERIFKKEAQTLYGTMIFYVEDNVLYEKDYVIRVINQEQEVEFRITRKSFTSSNTVDLVYNDDRQSIFRIFNHFVTLQTGEMTVSSSFNVS